MPTPPNAPHLTTATLPCACELVRMQHHREKAVVLPAQCTKTDMARGGEPAILGVHISIDQTQYLMALTI